MIKAVVISFLFFLSLISYGAETVVQGSFKDFDGKVIKVGVYEDYITQKLDYVAEGTIENGKYYLSFELNSTRQVVLKVEDKTTTFFAEAGGVFNIDLSYDEEKNKGQAFSKIIDLKFAYPKAGELNHLIQSFNRDYETFFSENYRRFVTKRADEVVKAFVSQQNKIKKYQANAFVANYVKYSLANLENINNAPKDDLFNNYLKSKEILYDNKEYMNFFTQYYKKDFEKLSLSKGGFEILKTVMLKKDMQQTIELIKKQKKIEQTALAELYLIYGLYDVYYIKTVDQKSSIEMLKQLSEKASNKENKLIAKNVVSKVKRVGKDQMAPAFSLKDEEGKTVSLSDLKDKPIYLGFWANWSIPSLQQMAIINKLYDKYKEKIQFVSINLDEDPKVMKKFKDEQKYNWIFLNYGDDYEIREKYDVRTVPTYYLIDAQGKFIASPAAAPTEIEKELYNLSK